MDFGKRLGLALTLSFVAIACSAPTIPSDLGSGDDGTNPSESLATKKKPTTKKPTTASDNGSTGTPSGTTPPKATSSGTMPPPAAANCSGSATADACFDCCNTASGGELAKADDAVGQCACGGGQCTSACGADFCTGAAPSAACESCLTATCEPAANAVCTSTACKAGQQCMQASACNQK